MSFESRLNILRWRAIEEADTGGEVISGERRREATVNSRQDITSEKAGDSASADAFLARRVAWLAARVATEGSRAAATLGALSVPRLHGSLLAGGWIAAVAGGFLLTGLGSEREINLLALPLVGLLLWNAVVMLASLLMELRPAKSPPAPPAWLARWMVPRPAEQGPATVAPPGQARFLAEAVPMTVARMNGTSRAWLHTAAALFAIGGALGMYAKGWSREYRAVWESTLLNENQASAFFGTLFAPAARASGVAIPLAELPGMHRTGGHTPAPAPALPWIHLYAGTLGLLVVAPRLLLAGLAVLRRGQRESIYWRSLGLESHARRLLRAVEGGEEHVEVRLHDARVTDAVRDRWTELVRRELGGQLSVDLAEIPGGDEDEFAAAWNPASHAAVLGFHFATTPEDEVHGRLARDLRARMRGTQPDGCLLVLLDAASIRERWTPEHRASHEALWRRCLQDSGAEVKVCD